MQKFCGFLRGFFKSTLKRRLGTQFQHITKNKKRGEIRVFSCALNVGASAPNPDTRNFSRKVSWNFKSFAKIKWCSRGERTLFYIYKLNFRAPTATLDIIAGCSVHENKSCPDDHTSPFFISCTKR